MTKTITQIGFTALVLVTVAFTGCDSNTGVVEPPVMTAEEQAALEARQAEYSKSMAESYGKSDGN